MGKAHSKFPGLSYGQSRSDPKDPAGRALFSAGRSSSMDSLSTAVSLQTHPNPLTHSTSLDNLRLSSEPSRNGQELLQSHSTRVEIGKEYTLLDAGGTSKASGGREECTLRESESERSRKEREGKRRRREKGQGSEESRGEKRLTQSLPAAVERSVGGDRETLTTNSHFLPRPRSEPDAFSDNFIASENRPFENGLRPTDLVEDSTVSAAPVEGALVVREASLDDQQAQQLSSASPEAVSSAPSGSGQTLPGIPSEILHKLSRDEWNTVVSVTCSTLQQTLQSSIDKQLKHERTENWHSLQKDRNPTTAMGGHAQNSDSTPHPNECDFCSHCMECRECGLERRYSARSESRAHKSKRRKRGERPNSLPPLYLRSTILETTEEPGSAHSDGLSPTGDVPMRRRSRSHESCYFYRCQDQSAVEKDPSSGGAVGQRRKPCECGRSVSRCSNCEGLESSSSSCSSGSSGHRKKRSTRPDRNERVDPSIDDDCPRVFENRVRRKNRHTAACERCKAQRKQHRCTLETNSEINLADFDNPDTNVEYVDLGQLKTLALLESVAQRLKLEGSNGTVPTDFRQHRKLKGKQHSVNLEDVSRLRSTIKLDDSLNLKELLFPTQTRTGRDSPRTDMAVAGLEMSSPNMFNRATKMSGSPRDCEQRLYRNQGLSVSDSSLSRHQILPLSGLANDANTDMTVIHQHHHFHHIVHHSQP